MAGIKNKKFLGSLSDSKESQREEQKQSKDFRHLVRIANTDIPGEKRLGNALTKIKGVNFMFANMICNLTGMDKQAKTGELSEDQINKIEAFLKNPLENKTPLWMLNRRKDILTGEDIHIITSDLDFTKENDLRRMKMTKSYKGRRHSVGLPVRGQRTKSNFRKNKGKVAGVKKKKGKAGRV